MEGKLQQRRRQSKERKAAMQQPSPDPSQPRFAALPQTPKKEPRVVFSSLEQRRRESKEKKLEATLAAEADPDTPKAKRDRVAPTQHEVFVRVLDAPTNPSSGRNSNARSGQAKHRRSYYIPAKENPGAKLLAVVSGGPSGQPRAALSTGVKPPHPRITQNTPDAKLALADAPNCDSQKSPALPKKQLMVLKVKFDRPQDSTPPAKKPQKTAQDRTRTSTRPKKQSPSRSAKKKRSSGAEKPGAASRLSTSKQKAASNVKEADRLLSALNLIIHSRVDRE